jgi:hypothetical protein
MTCFDVYVSEHTLPVVGCPHDFKYAPQPANCYSISCFKDCWARECNKVDCEKKAREKK